MKITLTNSFHGTQTVVNALSDSYGRLILKGPVVKRARRDLCGITGCTCGGVRDDRYHLDPLDSMGSKYAVRDRND